MAKTKLNETSQKIIRAGIAAWIRGRSVNFKMTANLTQCEALSKALWATKHLDEEINRPQASVEKILELAKAKREAAQLFETSFGMPWPV